HHLDDWPRVRQGPGSVVTLDEANSDAGLARMRGLVEPRAEASVVGQVGDQIVGNPHGARSGWVGRGLVAILRNDEGDVRELGHHGGERFAPGIGLTLPAYVGGVGENV